MALPYYGYARFVFGLVLSSYLVNNFRNLSNDGTGLNTQVDGVVHDGLTTLVLPKSHNVTEKDDTQVERFDLLRKGCSSHASDPPLAASGKFYLYRNVTWSVVPKTGTKNILSMICMMVGRRCSEKAGNVEDHLFVPRFMVRHNEGSLKQYFRESKKRHPFIYTVVRDPWDRIVSTYVQKFIYTNKFKNLCKDLADHAVLEKQSVPAHARWTFKEFLESCIVGQFDEGGHAHMNLHWRPQHACADVCNIDYNYLAKTETYDEDIRVILTHYGVNNPEKLIKESYKHRRDNEKAGKTSHHYIQLWDSVEPALLKRLQDIYRKDTEYFGYSANPL